MVTYLDLRKKASNGCRNVPKLLSFANRMIEIMLVYPKEDHAIQIPENQIDLTNCILDWYGYYLKDEKRPKWFEPQ